MDRYDDDGTSGPGDVDAALPDEELRELLTSFPTAPGSALPPEVTAQIHDLVSNAWPDGMPPTVDELAEEAGGQDGWGHDYFYDGDLLVDAHGHVVDAHEVAAVSHESVGHVSGDHGASYQTGSDSGVDDGSSALFGTGDDVVGLATDSGHHDDDGGQQHGYGGHDDPYSGH